MQNSSYCSQSLTNLRSPRIINRILWSVRASWFWGERMIGIVATQVYSQRLTELWKLMNVVFNNKKRIKCFLIKTDESVPTAIFPRRLSFLFRQTVRTFTLEHLISYTVGLGFLFVFFILPTAKFRGVFRGVFRSVPRCPLFHHNGNPSKKGTL